MSNWYKLGVLAVLTGIGLSIATTGVISAVAVVMIVGGFLVGLIGLLSPE